MSHYPRIACLCTEAVETLYALGAQDCIAGISGFTVSIRSSRSLRTRLGWHAIFAVRDAQLCDHIAAWQVRTGHGVTYTTL